MSEANNKVLKRQLEVLISILLHKKSRPQKVDGFGTPWGNRTLNCPLGGGCYIHLTKEAYMLFDAQYFIR